jgi:hypothetical protein
MIAERQLRAAQQLTMSVIEGAGALVYAKDLQGRYILSNEAWRRLHRPDAGAGALHHRRTAVRRRRARRGCAPTTAR